MLRMALLPFTLLLSIATAQLYPRGVCNTSTEWETTPTAYLGAETDTKLRDWWTTISVGPHSAFTTELGKAFGSHVPYQCGLTDDSGCIYAGCSDFEDNGDPVWAYMSQISMVNLHILFKAIEEGITKGQLDFTDRVDKMVLTFFPWKESNFAPEDVLIWMSGIIGVAGAIAPILAASSAAAKRGEAAIAAGGGGFAALAGAGLSQISNEIKPDSIAGFASIATFKDFAAEYGEALRSGIDNWSNTTFNGDTDASNYTFLDYFRGGAMVDHSYLPSATDIESFYKKQLFSIIINSQWRKRKIWTTFHATNDTFDASGPNQTRYYSPADGGIYYTYAYHESGILKGFLEPPTGLDHLNESTWDISGTDISKSSAASFRTARFNFTEAMAHDALADALASNGTSSPWADGAGWVGTWTLPVCVLPSGYNWNSQYANTSSRYGMLPCCCGENCKDTKDFVTAANLVGFQTLLYGCEAQLRGTEIAFADVDYGFGKKTGPAALPYFWATLGTGKKAGLAVGMIVGGFVVLALLIACLGACCGMCFG